MLAAMTTGSAPAKPGEGIRVGDDVVVRPFVEASYSYDTNPGLLPEGQEKNDSFLDVSPGVGVTRSQEEVRYEGLVWGRFRRFRESISGNTDDWSEELRLGLGRRDNWNMKLHERFGRVSDYDLVVRNMDSAADGTGNRSGEFPDAPPLSVMERTERVDRYLLDCGVGAGGPLTDKLSMDALYDYGLVDYVPSELYDSNEHKASLKVSRQVTDKSSAIGVGEFIQMRNDSLVNPANYYAARAGWRWQGTFKSRFEGSVGYYGFSADEPGSADSLGRDGTSYDVAWYGQVRPKLSVTLGGRSEMQLAPDTANNAKMVNMLTSSAQYSATRRLTLSLLVGYRHEDFGQEEVLAGDVRVQREVEQLHGRLRGEYQLLKWLKGYGELWQEATEDNVRGDYTETRGTLGVKAEY